MIDAKNVHPTLRRYQLADGFPLVLDLEGSHGSWFRDGLTGDEYLDCFTSFASWPIGFNHPGMDDPAFTEEITRAAKVNPANSDLYTVEMAKFVEAFGSRVTPEGYDHHFWVAGGALAVENALKAAFDWKARKLGRTRMDESGNDLVILHFRQAFHGRSGYTMSLTNTDPKKVGLFPKFEWPRVSNPFVELDHDGNVLDGVAQKEATAVKEIEAAFECYAGRIAGILIEPMQGEGGDNHFRPEFLAELRRIADEKEALLIFDEVQTGFFGSGKRWLFEHKGVRPDVVAFGKKSQVCGIFAGPRIDEVHDNVFQMSSRINSTWGSNLVDMVRSRRIIEIVESENLMQNVTERGSQLVAGLRELAKEKGGLSNVRGVGSLVAFTLESPAARDALRQAIFERKLIVLPSGTQSIRFRLPLTITAEEVDEAVGRVAAAMPALVS